MLATPTTLIAMLKTVAYAWSQETVADNAREVQHLGRELYDRLGKVGGHLDALGRSIDTERRQLQQRDRLARDPGARQRAQDARPAGDRRRRSPRPTADRDTRPLTAPELVDPLGDDDRRRSRDRPAGAVGPRRRRRADAVPTVSRPPGRRHHGEGDAVACDDVRRHAPPAVMTTSLTEPPTTRRHRRRSSPADDGRDDQRCEHAGREEVLLDAIDIAPTRQARRRSEVEDIVDVPVEPRRRATQLTGDAARAITPRAGIPGAAAYSAATPVRGRCRPCRPRRRSARRSRTPRRPRRPRRWAPSTSAS